MNVASVILNYVIHELWRRELCKQVDEQTIREMQGEIEEILKERLFDE